MIPLQSVATTSLRRQPPVLQLSSPLPSGRHLSVASPVSWLLLTAILLMFAATAAWSWRGTITQTATGRGILMGPAGVASVNAPGSGLVVAVLVKVGDTVQARQLVARIGNPLLAEQVRLAESALADARREADRNVALKRESASLQVQAHNDQIRNLENEIAGLEHQTVFAAEQAENQQKLFEEGLATKSAMVAAQERLASIQAEMRRRQTQIRQIEAERFAAEAGVVHADAGSRERVADLERNLEALRENLRETTSVTAACAGRITEMRTYPGAMVSAGAPLLTVQPVADALQGVVYIASRQAKYLNVGMEAQVSPSNTRPEEQGYLRATVLSISPYPVSPVAINRSLENEALTTALTSEGPVTEVRLALRQETAVGGYAWSSRQGARVLLTGGTLCSARIVISRQRPLTLALPALKEALGTN